MINDPIDFDPELCRAEVGDSLGNWTDFRQCTFKGKHDVLVREHRGYGKTPEPNEPFTVKLCGVHKKRTYLHIVTKNENDGKYHPHRFSSMTVKQDG